MLEFLGDHRRGPDTARLSLRAFEATDAEPFFRLNSDPEVNRYTGDPPCESVAAAKAAILAYPDWEQPGIGRWATVHRATGAVIGFAGLKYLPELGEVDLGYRFLPAFWGRGLATEASRACLAYGFETLGLQRVIGLTDPENQASMRVLEKIGMLPEGSIEYHGQPANLFAVDVTRHRALSGR